jgi:hypothetical protein
MITVRSCRATLALVVGQTQRLKEQKMRNSDVPSDNQTTILGLRLHAAIIRAIKLMMALMQSGRASLTLVFGSNDEGPISIGMVLVIGALVALLCASIYYAWKIWTAFGPADMPSWIYGPIAGGVLFSLAIGWGLMALMFYSSRAGYDDAAAKSNSNSGSDLT